MKLLHVIGGYDIKSGGTYTALVSLVKMFEKLGHTNSIIATGSDHSSNGTTNTDVICFDRSFPKKFRKSKKAKNWLRENIVNYDAVIVHEIWGGIGLDACLLAMKNHVKYYVWPHGSLDPFDLQKKKYIKKILGKVFVNRVLKNAQYICCTSEKEKQVIDCFGTVSDNIISLPLPVDFCLEDEIGKPRPSLITPELPADAFAFLFFSRINYKKGLDLFLRAFAQCLAEKLIKDNCYLLIAGSGTPEYENYIDNLITELNLKAHVVKLGLVTGNDKLKVYKNAHIFILPSLNENFGLSVIESLQSGTPVLISDNIYIHEELFADAAPGWLCQYDIDNLKRKIVESTFVQAKEQVAAKKVGQKFTTSSLLPVYKEAFNE